MRLRHSRGMPALVPQLRVRRLAGFLVFAIWRGMVMEEATRLVLGMTAEKCEG